jgi:hypothetical protein
VSVKPDTWSAPNAIPGQCLRHRTCVAPSPSKALLQGALLLVLITVSCGGSLSDPCNCTPTAPVADDYRHLQKHVALPSGTPQEINVNTILSWAQDRNLPFEQPRTGRELQLFHINKAYLQSAGLMHGDCDIHFEISQTSSKAAPRVIVETPVDTEYCPARRTIQTELARKGFALDARHGGELAKPVSVTVLGLAFEDFEHHRGTAQVATVWELHPAIVTVTQ